MRYLLSGGAGFLGSHFCDYLLERGHEVWCLDDLSTGDQRNLAQAKNNPAFHAIEHNVINPLPSLGVTFDYVMHLASPASPVDYRRLPLHTLLTGSTGTQNMLDLARKDGARFFLASTSEVYGDPLEHPQVESYYGNVNTVGDRSIYDEAKRYAETITDAYQRHYGLQTRIVRIFNTYGPRMQVSDGRVVPNFICQAIRGEALTVYGEGSQTRSFCYYSDLIEGMHRLLLSDVATPVNIGNPGEFTIEEFASEVLKITGSTSKVTFVPMPGGDDPKRRRPDIAKARTLLGWEPRIPLAEGLKSTVAYFRERLAAGS